MDSPEVVTLTTLADGAALELFQRALGEVLANIDNESTDAEAKRTIRLEVTFSPDDERRLADISVKCSTKLAGIRGASTRIFMGRHKGELVAVESNPQQAKLFPTPQAELRAVSAGAQKENQ